MSLHACMHCNCLFVFCDMPLHNWKWWWWCTYMYRSCNVHIQVIITVRVYTHTACICILLKVHWLVYTVSDIPFFYHISSFLCKFSSTAFLYFSFYLHFYPSLSLSFPFPSSLSLSLLLFLLFLPFFPLHWDSCSISLYILIIIFFIVCRPCSVSPVGVFFLLHCQSWDH